jgi:intracellular septation protein
MNFIYEILPVFLFFIAFKLYDIYVATIVGILATAAQVLFNRFWLGQWDRKQVITFAAFVLFGGMTLYFHNPIFVKWKPTIVFWLFTLVIIVSQFLRRPIAQRLMEGMLQGKSSSVPPRMWSWLNVIWACFFLVLGAVNLYIAYHFTNDAWVNFKFYGITSALFLFSLLQALLLMPYISDEKTQ